ncbi:MAG: hypothetical protein DRJ43_02025 [Thermoprotei archaeon]|nr:MAG: hypothetical protein DRJ43_02025 [Thermoprotei archaeon]
MSRMVEMCGELRADKCFYELFTIGIVFALLLGYTALGLRRAISDIPSIGADSVEELVLAVTALYASFPVHELLHGLTLASLGLKPRVQVSRFGGYIPLPQVVDESSSEIDYRSLAIISLTPIIASLIAALASALPSPIDYPLLLLAMGNVALSSWDAYLLFTVRKLPGVKLAYGGASVQLLGDCDEISRRLVSGLSGERYVKHWAGWTWFYFTVLFVMFLLVELGSIGFREGFTLKLGPILVFYVEPVRGGFKTGFNLPGAYGLAAILAVPSAYASKRIVERLA